MDREKGPGCSKNVREDNIDLESSLNHPLDAVSFDDDTDRYSLENHPLDAVSSDEEFQIGTKRPYRAKGPFRSEEGKGKQLPSGFPKKAKISNYNDDDPNFCIHSRDTKTKTMVTKDSVNQTDYTKNSLSVIEHPYMPPPQLLVCEACGLMDKRISVVQCCDGHSVCTKCVVISTKTELSEAKKGFVECPQHRCESSVPQSELRKALPPLMLDRLEGFWKEQTIQAVEKMSDIVRCPSCQFMAALDIREKKFKCTECKKAYCRYCKLSWKRRSHDHCNETKKRTSTVGGDVETTAIDSEEQAGSSKEANSIYTNNSESFFSKVANPILPPAPRTVCGACYKVESQSSVVQCCDGHNVCAKCVEICMKAELSKVEKGFVNCPQDGCGSSVPQSELRKAFPSLMVDLLEDSWKKQNTEAIEQMNDLVRCPFCTFIAALDIHQKRVRCPRKQCREAFCRYCEMKWVERPSHDLCIKTKKWTSTVTGNVVNIPAHWSESDCNAEGHVVKEVSSSTAEFKDVVAYINKFMLVNVSKVFRIQNERLWEKYSLTRCHMVADLGELDINERRLFHGTNRDVIDAICKEGFDWRLCGKHGVKYGRGSYFAESPRLSHRYSSRSSQPKPASTNFGGVLPSGNISSSSSSSDVSSNATTISAVCNDVDTTSANDYFMFLARVVVGRSCVGSSQMRRPERDSQGRETHSAVDNDNGPAMFVIFDNTQCYPEYLIQYSVP